MEDEQRAEETPETAVSFFFSSQVGVIVWVYAAASTRGGAK